MSSLAAMPDALTFKHMFLWPFLVGLVVTLAAGPLVRRIAVKCELYDRPDAGLKPHAKPIPYLGGVAMYLGWMAAILCAMVWVPACRNQMPWIAAGGSVLMLTGLIDDLKHLSPKVRLLIQFAIAVLLMVGGVGREIGEVMLTPLADTLPAWASGSGVRYGLGLAFSMFVLAGATNSTNLIDGLDGLCAGIVAIAAVGFLLVNQHFVGTILAADPDALVRALLAVAVLAACLGFLRLNFNPASMFMGDSGSLLLGFSVAVTLILFAEQASWRWLLAAIVVFAFPVFDTALAIARRRLNGKPLFVGDRSHFYDQLRDRGISVRRTVLICYTLGIAAVGIALVLLRLPTWAMIGAFAACPILAALACSRLGLLRVDDAAQRSNTATNAKS